MGNGDDAVAYDDAVVYDDDAAGYYDDDIYGDDAVIHGVILPSESLVIVLGLRGILSLIGLTTMMIGYWASEKKWDEDGSAAYYRAAENKASADYQVVDEATGAPTNDPETPQEQVSQPPQNHSADDPGNVIVPKEELVAAAPLPKLMLAGFGLWSLSMFFHPTYQYTLYLSGWNLSAVILMIIIVILTVFPMRQASIERDVELKTKVSKFILFLSFWVIFVTMCDQEVDAHWYTVVFSGMFFFLSYPYIRKSRKMGISWDYFGQPSQVTATQNFGFIFLFFAVFLFWVGTNAVLPDQVTSAVKIPLYSGIRTILTFIAGPFIILPAQLLLDYAFDAGSSQKGRFCLNGETFVNYFNSVETSFQFDNLGYMIESPLFYLLGWAILALSTFMPFEVGTTNAQIITAVCLLVTGLIYSLKVMPLYWRGYYDQHRRWTGVYFASMGCVVLSVGVHSLVSFVLASLGALGILAGQHLDMFERKRGFYWLYERKTNPKPTAFGIGQPLHITGWILMCLALCILY